MSEPQYTPWDKVFGPSSPENLTVPTPLPPPTPLPVTPAPVPVPVNPPPAVPTKSSSNVVTIVATLFMAGVVGLASYAIANRDETKPNPVTPSGPVLPVVDANLSKLLPDKAARGIAASYFRDVSDFLGSAKAVTTTGQVRDVVQAASKDLIAAIGSPNWSAINTPISNRIAVALGGTPGSIPDIPLDVPLASGQTPRQILIKEYAQIAVDCRGG